MTIYNFGSINADLFYHLPHLPAPGETLAARGHERGLGGKGANQSVAAARAGSRTVHIGAVGPDGGWAIERLARFGVETQAIKRSKEPTGHAIINVDADGENTIVIWPGANRGQSRDHVRDTLSKARPGDYLMLQNETDCLAEAAELGQIHGLRVIFSAAPFDVASALDVLPFTDVLLVNEIEMEQLSAALSKPISAIPVPAILVTKGAHGADYHDQATGEVIRVAALPVAPVDTTGAGDTFAGYFVAGLDQGMDVRSAMEQAAAAAACKVTRKGTADAIPTRDELTQFLKAFT